MSAAPGSFPRRIAAGGRCGELGFGGSLLIAPGSVTWEFSQSAAYKVVWRFAARSPLPPQVIHAELPIIVQRSRLAPPGLNRILVVRGEGATVAVQAWFGRWRRIRAALQDAGIPTIERTVLFAIRSQEGRDGNPNARVPDPR